MRNNRNSLFDKKLPAFSGMAVLVLSLVTITWLSGNALIFGTKAANGSIPHKVQISNVTDSSFTVSYFTDEFAIGSISYGTDSKLGKIGLDDRDQLGGSPISHKIHHITVKQLTPSTRYSFIIASGDQTFKDNGYTVSTAPPTSEKPTTQAPAIGTVSRDDGDIPAEGIVYLSSDTSQLLSVLLKPDGSYLLPLNTIRKKDLSGLLIMSADTTLQMVATDGKAQSTIALLASQTNPVPRVVLSKDYTFTANDSVIEAATAPEASESASLPEREDTSQVSSPEILSPHNDEKFQDQKPMFSGKALPNESVEITIHSEQEVKATVQADANGNWEYRPTVPLAPGDHTITIASVDVSGALQSLTNSFVVHAQGSQFTEPSVSPTPAFDTTPSPSPSPTVVFEPSPTASVSATPTLQPTPTTISASPSASVSITQPPIPKSGSSSLMVVLFGTLLFIGVGVMLFFVTKGGMIV